MNHNHDEHNCQECLRIFEAGCVTRNETIKELIKEIDEWREEQFENKIAWRNDDDHDAAMGVIDSAFVKIYDALGCYDKKE